MLDIKDKSKCCGCAACVNICPKQCIAMEHDEEGFLYPMVDADRCIGCDACARVCPEINLPALPETPKKAAAVMAKDVSIRMQSSSGGVFSLVAQKVLSDDGKVFGAAFDEEFQVKHVCIQHQEELDLIRRSKYTQSKIGFSFSQTKQLLLAGERVLFVGTPCQIAGLKNYLGKEYQNLYTIDFICHGVPAPLIWKRYLEYRKGKDKRDKIKRISFRQKDPSWKNYKILIEYEDKVYLSDTRRDLYMTAFLSDIGLRPACYECPFKTKSRCSDITLADFWGIQAVLPEMDDDRGTSLVICHSEKGEKILEQIAEECLIQEVELEQAIRYNPSLVHSALKNPNRDQFMREIKERRDFKILVKKYCRSNIFQRGYRKIKRILRKILFGIHVGNCNQ